MIISVKKQKLKLSNINIKTCPFVPIELGTFVGAYLFQSTLKVTLGEKVTCHWGDGSFTVYTGLGNTEFYVEKDYDTVGPHIITVSWNITDITYFHISDWNVFYLNISNYSVLTGLNNIKIEQDGGSLIGSINDLPASLTYLWLKDTSGDSNLTGSIENLSTNLKTLYIYGCGTNITYSDGVIPAWANTTITISAGWDTAMLDAFLISWATTAGAGVKTIDLSGTNEYRSTDSDDAVAILNGLGKTIIVNGVI